MEPNILENIGNVGSLTGMNVASSSSYGGMASAVSLEHAQVERGRVRLPSSSETMKRNGKVSCFDVSLMPTESIHKRELHSFSIHYSVATAKWIATLTRAHDGNLPRPYDKPRCVSFSFEKEREARIFAKAYTPPKMMADSTHCVSCSVQFTAKCRSSNCRNCGVQVCDKCSTRWGIRMLPKTYLGSSHQSLTVRVCKSCDWLSNAFCMALLQGKYDQALKFHSTGNLNLRCTFADIHKEAMFPVHCAVMGGNLELVKWLVDEQKCPISVRSNSWSGLVRSIQTSNCRTLIDLAMTGKPKIEILSFLVRRNLSILDTKDPSLAPKTLQTLLAAGFAFEKKESEGDIESIQPSEDFDLSSMATIEDACIICCERQMDCVLTPCGHQVCCSTCGTKLTECPVCKKACNVLKVFRM